MSSFYKKNFVSTVFVNLRRCHRSFSTGEESIRVEKIGTVTAFEIHKPENKNELDEESFTRLCESIKTFENDDTAFAGVIYGFGGNFCSGCCKNYTPDIRKLFFSTSKPLVAGISGYATGFGFELALACDLRVMEDTAQIGLNGFPAKMSEFSYQRLVAIAGFSLAMDLALTGRNVHFREGSQTGLVDRPVECGTAIGQGLQQARCMAKFPLKDLREAKSAILSAWKMNPPVR